MHFAEWRWWRFSPPWTRGTRTWSTMLKWISMAPALPPALGAALLLLWSFTFFSSSDRSVRIFDVKDGTQSLAASLVGHEGPVWQVAWAHPRWTEHRKNKSTKMRSSVSEFLDRFGNILASCSYDRRVLIWQENQGQWTKVVKSCWVNNDHVAQSADSWVLKYRNSAAPWLLNWLSNIAKWNVAQCSLAYLHCWEVFLGDQLCVYRIQRDFTQIHEYTNHDSSVNSVQWAPHDFGLVSSIGLSIFCLCMIFISLLGHCFRN